MRSASLHLKNNAPSSDSAADERTGFIMVLLVIMAPLLGVMGLCGCGWRMGLIDTSLRKKWLPARLNNCFHRG